MLPDTVLDLLNGVGDIQTDQSKALWSEAPGFLAEQNMTAQLSGQRTCSAKIRHYTVGGEGKHAERLRPGTGIQGEQYDLLRTGAL